MKRRVRSFGMKLWLCFLLFAAIIFSALWLLQTVFLQSFYNNMAVRNVKQAAAQIAGQQKDKELAALIDSLASEHSLLIFLTDEQGRILYNTDEHNSVYEGHSDRSISGGGKDNPYRTQEGPMSWETGAYRTLPGDYSAFLQQLSASEDGMTGYTIGDGSAYVYGMLLPEFDFSGGSGAVLYISAQLDAVGGAVDILRMQLLWVTFASLIIGAVIAGFLSRQFSRPVRAISEQAGRMAAGEFSGDYKKGFCRELDELSDTLDETAESLRRLENARRELLANVSHDLRTPLTMIKGYAEMVRDISWSEDEKREEDLAVIIREADRLTDLVNDILEYSALQAEENAVQTQPFDMSAAVQSAAEQFAPLCAQRGCRMEISIEPEQWAEGDEDQIKRVLYNLIDNAITHSGSSPRVLVALKESGSVIRTEIRDYGDGIPKEELPLIWERYFTSKQRRKSGSRSGLGLAITREILEKQNAEFGVESEAGEGSLFWFEMKKADKGN